MVVFLQMMLVISCQIHRTIAIPLHIVNWHAVTLLSFEIHFTRQKPLRVVTINPRNIVKYNSFAPFVIVTSILILTSKLKCFLETWQWWCNKLSPNKWDSGRDSLFFLCQNHRTSQVVLQYQLLLKTHCLFVLLNHSMKKLLYLSIKVSISSICYTYSQTP